ncbi:hypothetical protein BVRB_9g203720 isoform B [Beta vulgaris subsp. vulgaris]|nr:hypothetical protein BVRB_9g203720 isoform B [Beta vulgaris subsp. vulgaris]
MLLTALFSDIQALPFSTSYRLFFEAHNEVLELYPPTSKLCRFYLIQDYRRIGKKRSSDDTDNYTPVI